MKSSLFWGMSPCSPLKVNAISEEKRLLATCSCLAYSSTLKMDATCSFGTSVDFQRTTRCCMPQDRALRTKRWFLSVQCDPYCEWSAYRFYLFGQKQAVSQERVHIDNQIHSLKEVKRVHDHAKCQIRSLCSFVLSLCTHETTREPVNGFSFNLIVGNWRFVCKISGVVNIERK
jgi:hypothetical protein